MMVSRVSPVRELLFFFFFFFFGLPCFLCYLAESTLPDVLGVSINTTAWDWLVGLRLTGG